jgi:rhodanese-related sulfurtransferase
MDITATELNQRLSSGEAMNLLDVRGDLEYNTFNIGGVNIALPKLPLVLDELDWDTDEEIIVLCTRGLRSATGKTILEQNGFTNVRNLTGGLIELQKLKK